MKNKLYHLLLLYILTTPIYAQVKIGENPSVIHPNSILELESTNKALVLSRMNNAQMNAITPLNGALIYNTEENCVFAHNGISWVNLCDTSVGINVTTSTTPPTNNNLGDFWINPDLNNTTSIWNGTAWVTIDNNPRRGNGAPTNTTAPNPLAGDVYVDSSTGNIYAYNGTIWVNSNNSYTANNGLLIDATNTIQLGGVLIKPTIISTTATNTLAIEGLEDGNTNDDAIVTVNKTTGVLRKINTSNILQEEITNIVAATNGQLQFTGLDLKGNTDKITVYRNGVRIDFTVVNNTTIEIEPDAACYTGDQIRIVQLY